MRRQRRWLPLLALLICINSKLSGALPVREDELDTSTRLLGSSVVTSVSVVSNDDDTGSAHQANGRKAPLTYDLPQSPPNLFTPDRFQFYTYNDRGDMITRQMTEQEIQSLIAAGGGHVPMDEPQKADDVLTGGKKVADVVQKVQNVLKSAMDRPTTVMSSIPTIPGHANDEWSSILPAILAGDVGASEPASIPETKPESSTILAEKLSTTPSDSKKPQSPAEKRPETTADSTTFKQETQPATTPASSSTQDLEEVLEATKTKKPIAVQPSKPEYLNEEEIQKYTEKPMIPVPVITVDQKLTTQKPETADSPMYQILNIIPAENVTREQEDSTKTGSKPQNVDFVFETSSMPADRPDQSTVAPGIIKETDSKVPGLVKDQVPVSIAPSDMVQLHIITDDKPTEEDKEKYSTMSSNPDSSTFVTMSVISETHSTSMKVPGHPEIPLQQSHVPAIAGMKPEDITSQVKVPETTPLPNVENLSTIAVSLDSEKPTPPSTSYNEKVTEKVVVPEVERVTLKDPSSVDVSSMTTESSPSTLAMSPERQPPTAVNSPDLPANASSDNSQKIHVVQTASHVVATESANFEDKVQDAESTTESVKIATQQQQEVTTPLPVNEKPVFQMLPEVKPEADHSESTAIEQIIETLNHKLDSGSTQSSSGSNVMPNDMKFNTAQLVESQTAETPSTFAPSSTSVKVDSKPEVDSKPMESLSTELANSLSSMINQVSDAVPAILPVSSSGPSDGSMMKNADYVPNQVSTMKPTTLKAVDEPTPVKVVEMIQDNPILEEIEEPLNGINLPLNVESPNSEDAIMKIPVDDSEPTIVFEPNLKETEEENIKLNMTSFLFDSDKLLPESSTAKTEAVADTSLNKDENASERVPVLSSEPILDSEAATIVDDSKSSGAKIDVTTMKATTEEIIADAVTAETSKVEAQTSLADNLSSTEPSVSPVSQKFESVTNKVSDVMEVSTEIPETVKGEVILAATPANKLNDEEQDTELKKPNSEEIVKVDSAPEIPLVKVQITDSASIVNEMLHTATVPSSTPSIEPINLPDDIDKMSVNNLASGLIAGFQSTTQKSVEKIATTPSSATTVPAEVKLTTDTESSATAEDLQQTEVKVKPPSENTEAEEKGQIGDSLSNMAVMENVGEDTSEFVKVEVVTEEIFDAINTQSSENKDSPTHKESDSKVSENITPSSNVQPDEKVPSKVQDPEPEVSSPVTETSASEDKKNEPESVNANVMSDVTQGSEGVTENVEVSVENKHVESIPTKTPSEEASKEEPEETSIKASETVIEEGVMKDQVVAENNASVNNGDKVPVKDESLSQEQVVSDAQQDIVSDSSKTPALSNDLEFISNATKVTDEISTEEVTVKPDVQVTPESTASSVEEDSSNAAKKPVKPEQPVVRIDMSPETIQGQLPAKIQLADLPIIQKIPLSNVEKSPTTTEATIDLKANITDVLSAVTSESPEKSESPAAHSENNEDVVGSMTGELPNKMETPLTRVELVNPTESQKLEKQDEPAVLVDSSTPKPPTTLIEIIQPPQSTLPSSTVQTPLEESTTVVYINKPVITEDHQQKIQEIRIQVNDTAVLVTKHPLPETDVPESSTSEKSPSEKIEAPSIIVSDKEDDTKKVVVTTTEQAVTPAFVKIETETVKPVEDITPTTQKIALITTTSDTKSEDIAVTPMQAEEVDSSTIKIVTELAQETSTAQSDRNIPTNEKGDNIDDKKEESDNADNQQFAISTESTQVKDSSVNSPVVDKVGADEPKQNVSVSDNENLQIVKVTTPQSIKEVTGQESKVQESHSTTLSTPVVTKQPLKVEKIPTPQAMHQPVPEKINTHTLGSNQKLPGSGIKKPAPETPTDHKWTLIPQQVPGVAHQQKRPPPKPSKRPEIVQTTTMRYPDEPQQKPVTLDASQTVNGLDASVKDTSKDIVNFSELCNELAFSFWMSTNKGLSTARSLALSPFGMTSLLAMIFLGARGPTSEQMNEILRLDDVATFNPHLVFQNVTDTVSLARNQGIANAAFVRELFADKSKVRKLMPFYKDQAQQFYEGLVAEVNFAAISDLVRRRTNLMIRKQTGGRIKDFVKMNTVPLRSPLAAMSANVFQTDCNSSTASSEGRDGELYFAVSPAVRQRKLVPVPATVWRAGVVAGYEPALDATAVALGGLEKLVSTIFVIPGQQGQLAPGDTLDRLEQRLVKGAFQDKAWEKLLKVLIPRPGLELQIPKFSHRSIINATAALKRMGLDELFSKHADLKGINGFGNHLHLADVLQMNLFSTCGDENIQSGRHHVEIYPSSSLRNSRHYESDELSVEGMDDVETKTEEEFASYEDTTAREGDYHEEEVGEENLEREKRDTSQERPRLKLDRPFLYFVRHNPTGLILHMGRFNPRLLP